MVIGYIEVDILIPHPGTIADFLRQQVCPIEQAWVIAVRDLCMKFQTPFVFKQWGGIRKKEHGRLLDGKTYDEMPAISLRPRTISEADRLNAILQIDNLLDVESLA